MALYTVFMVCSLPETLVKTLAKNLFKNMVEKLTKNSSDKLTANFLKHMLKALNKTSPKPFWKSPKLQINQSAHEYSGKHREGILDTPGHLFKHQYAQMLIVVKVVEDFNDF